MKRWGRERMDEWWVRGRAYMMIIPKPISFFRKRNVVTESTEIFLVFHTVAISALIHVYWLNIRPKTWRITFCSTQQLSTPTIQHLHLLSMSSSSFRRGTSSLPSATDMNQSIIASLFLAMSDTPARVSHVPSPLNNSLSLQILPAEELTVDTATAAAVVAAPTEVRRGGGGGGRCS